MGKCQQLAALEGIITLDSNLKSAFKSPKVTARLIPPCLNHTTTSTAGSHNSALLSTLQLFRGKTHQNNDRISFGTIVTFLPTQAPIKEPIINSKTITYYSMTYQFNNQRDTSFRGHFNRPCLSRT